MNELKKIPDGWVETTLGEVVESANTGLDAIKRAPIVEEETGIKCFRIQDASQKKIYKSWGNTLVEDKNYKRFQLIKGDILIARTGNTIGVNYLVKQNLKSVFNNGLIRLRVNEKCDYQFLYKIIESKIFDRYIQSIAYGTSTQPNMQINVLLGYELLLPPLPEQKAIASILTAFDDKVELLQAQNKTLEETAQTIFAEWFGKYNIEDELPEGWRVGKFGEVTSMIARGITPKYLIEGGICVLNQKCIRNKTIDFSLSRRHDNLNKNATPKFIDLYDILINSTGTGTLGRTAIVKRLEENPTTVDSHITIVRTNNSKISKLFLAYSLTSKEREIELMAEGSTGQTELSRAKLNERELLIPPFDVQNNFEYIANPILQKIALNEEQIQTLTQTRDELLPRLISGEVRVKI